MPLLRQVFRSDSDSSAFGSGTRVSGEKDKWNQHPNIAKRTGSIPVFGSAVVIEVRVSAVFRRRNDDCRRDSRLKIFSAAISDDIAVLFTIVSILVAPTYWWRIYTPRDAGNMKDRVSTFASSKQRQSTPTQ